MRTRRPNHPNRPDCLTGRRNDRRDQQHGTRRTGRRAGDYVPLHDLTRNPLRPRHGPPRGSLRWRPLVPPDRPRRMTRLLLWLRALLAALGARYARVRAAIARGCAALGARWPRLALAVSRAGRWLCRVGAAARLAGRAARRIAGRAAGRAAARGRRAYDWTARRAGPLLRPVGRVLRRVLRCAGRVAVRIGWGAGRVLLRCWRAVRPWLRDAAGWLWHAAPRLALRLTWRLVCWFARWAPRTVWRLLVWSLLGAGFVLRHGFRYCLAYNDYAALLREAQDEEWPRRVFAVRRAWRRAAARRTGVLAALTVTAIIGVHVVINSYGPAGATAVIVVLLGGLALIGCALRPPPEKAAAEPETDPEGPYPIADAHTRAEAADCAARALAAEGIELRMAGESARTRWGWEIPVVLRSGTPAAIVAKTGELETHMDLPAGGVLATPDQARRARVVLRLAERDPFGDLRPIPPRALGSASITERAVIGRRIDGHDLAVPLLGVHGVVIGSSGSGKSTTLVTLADAVTACRDALAWDLDPAGLGLDALGEVIDRRERDPAGIEHALADALAVAEARPRLFGQFGMRDAWDPAPDRAALVVFVDEYPRLSTRAKDLAVNILRVGRKSRVTLILAATEATSDALGAAVAESTGLQIMHPCRHGDVRLVFGPQRLAEGWRPDRLHPATADDPGHAGQCYVATAGHREPLVSKVAARDTTDARHTAQPVAGRHATDRPRLDTPSWHAVLTRRAATSSTGSTGTGSTGTGNGGGFAGGRVADERVRRDMLACFGTDDRLSTDDLLSRLAEYDPHTYDDWTAEDVAAALRPWGATRTQLWIDGRNRKGYLRDTIATPPEPGTTT